MSENRVTMQQKKAVAERAKGCCEYCQSQVRFAIQPFSVEHIIPKSQGGKTTLDNLALSCQGCNNHKYNKTVGRDILSGNVVLYTIYPKSNGVSILLGMITLIWLLG